MTRLIGLFLLLAVINSGKTQSVSTQMGARAAGMAFASSGLTDEWGIFNNVGSIGSQEKITAAVAYELRTQLKNANRMAFAFNAPMRWGVGSIGVFRFGDDLYSEQIISAGLGNKFGITSLGIKVNYIQYYAEGFGTHSTVSLDFGGITRLTDQLSIGAYITNLNQAKINNDYNSERMPTRLTAGLTFKPQENILITSELDKDLDYDLIWRTGFEYSFKQKFFVRSGVNIKPQSGFFGLGTKRKNLQADYAFQFNTLTGASHQASASYWFNRKQAK
ncbi:MAG: hypothetical protein JNM78_02680 [Cyclobacteriaceae bacterium]|nr:hypothetical protein [Cyclobacteriaceae bacterium]